MIMTDVYFLAIVEFPSVGHYPNIPVGNYPPFNDSRANSSLGQYCLQMKIKDLNIHVVGTQLYRLYDVSG